MGGKSEVRAVLVLTSKVYEGRLLRKVASTSQAVECEKGGWMRNIGRCVSKLVGHEWWCDQGVIRGRCERYVAECCLEECKG